MLNLQLEQGQFKGRNVRSIQNRISYLKGVELFFWGDCNLEGGAARAAKPKIDRCFDSCKSGLQKNPTIPSWCCKSTIWPRPAASPSARPLRLSRRSSYYPRLPSI